MSEHVPEYLRKLNPHSSPKKEKKKGEKLPEKPSPTHPTSQHARLALKEAKKDGITPLCELCVAVGKKICPSTGLVFCPKKPDSWRRIAIHPEDCGVFERREGETASSTAAAA